MAEDISDLVAEDMKLAPSNEALKAISALAEEQLNLEAEIADLLSQVSEKSVTLKRISEQDIPAAMTAAGMQSFTLMSSDPERVGAKVTCKPDVAMSLSGAVKPKVITWLKENGHGDVVSNEIIVAIPKGTDATLVERLRVGATKLGLAYSEEENVNTATVKALYKEQREKGAKLDPADFGAYHYTKTDIKLPSDKKAAKPRASKKK